jgi:hypothetical protein
MNYSDAYRAAYNVRKMAEKTINDEASKLAKDPDITVKDLPDIRAGNPAV